MPLGLRQTSTFWNNLAWFKLFPQKKYQNLTEKERNIDAYQGFPTAGSILSEPLLKSFSHKLCEAEDYDTFTPMSWTCNCVIAELL